MKIEIDVKNIENSGPLSEEKIERYQEIITSLIETGSLDNIKGGSVELHFDPNGIFQGTQQHFFAWRRRKSP
mgnify:CR=1 FL=1